MALEIDPRIKMRHLVCFVAVCRAESMQAAAATLHMSQPAATKTIQELEQTLGKALFDRSRRKLSLTASGEMFLRYATTSLAALRQGITVMRHAGDDPIIKIGALPTVSALVLPRAVRSFTAQWAGARTRIITGPNAYLLSLLRQGDVDLVIGRMAEPNAIEGLAFEHLYSERIAFVVRSGHPLLGMPAFQLSMIARYPVLMPPPDAVIRPTVERLLTAHGVVSLQDEVETVSDAFGRSFTRMTDVVWIISRGVVADDVADEHLALLPVDTAETLGPVGVTTRTDTSLSAGAEVLIGAIRNEVAEIREAP